MSRLSMINGGAWTNILAIPDEERSGLFSPQFGYGYHKRGEQATSFEWEPQQRWPWSIMSGGDPSVPLSPMVNNIAYEPTNLGIGGYYRPYYVRGTVKDSVGNVVGGATVQLFVTSTDKFVAEGQTNSNGSYEVPTPSAVAHYAVAYVTGSPDRAGSTVNTLTPVV